jgi:hypothetical protein
VSKAEAYYTIKDCVKGSAEIIYKRNLLPYTIKDCVKGSAKHYNDSISDKYKQRRLNIRNKALTQDYFFKLYFIFLHIYNWLNKRKPLPYTITNCVKGSAEQYNNLIYAKTKVEIKAKQKYLNIKNKKRLILTHIYNWFLTLSS